MGVGAGHREVGCAGERWGGNAGSTEQGQVRRDRAKSDSDWHDMPLTLSADIGRWIGRLSVEDRRADYCWDGNDQETISLTIYQKQQ